MDCDIYDADYHIRLMISLGRGENISSSPSVLEYHMHASNSENDDCRCNLRFGEVWIDSKWTQDERRDFLRGVDLIKTEVPVA